MKKTLELSSLDGTIEAAKTVAKRYRKLTGKPLGITGEIGEVQAASLLGLKLAEARQAGYDAKDSRGRRVQIKSRCVLPGSRPSQRVGGIRFNHGWDVVVLILMDEDFEPIEIHEVTRRKVYRALLQPGSKARNERGSLGVNKFRAIGKQVWPK